MKVYANRVRIFLTKYGMMRPDIEVFDIHFIEDYLFNSSIVSEKN